MLQLKFAKDEKPTNLDEAIERVFTHLQTLQPDSKEYATTADQLVKLQTLKDTTKSKNRPSADALVAAGASVLGILLIVGYEHAHVMTSRAVNFVTKATH